MHRSCPKRVFILMYVNLFTSIMGWIIDRSMISSHTLFAHMYVNAAQNSSDMQIGSQLCMVITVGRYTPFR